MSARVAALPEPFEIVYVAREVLREAYGVVPHGDPEAVPLLWTGFEGEVLAEVATLYAARELQPLLRRLAGKVRRKE